MYLMNFIQILEITSEGLESLFDFFGAFLLIGVVFVIAEYIIKALFLNQLHKLIYGKGSILVWIPFVNDYMLGKLTINNIVGIILVLVDILSLIFLQTEWGNSFFSICNDIKFGFLIYSGIKYYDLKYKNNKNNYVINNQFNPNMQSQGQFYQQQTKYNQNGEFVSQQYGNQTFQSSMSVSSRSISNSEYQVQGNVQNQIQNHFNDYNGNVNQNNNFNNENM